MIPRGAGGAVPGAQYEEALAQLAAQNPNVPITQTSNRSTEDTDSATVLNAEAAVAGAQYDYDSSVAKLREAEANNRKSQSDPTSLQKSSPISMRVSLSDYDQYLANAGSQQAAVEASLRSPQHPRKRWWMRGARNCASSRVNLRRTR